MNSALFPTLGFGLGLRATHYEDILAGQTTAEWFEAIGENYIGIGGAAYGAPLRRLEQVRQKFPVVIHCVGMSLGSHDELNLEYFQRLKELIQTIDPVWVSDHLCWTGIHGRTTHDLLPLPYTQEAVKHMVSRIQQAQDLLGRRILIENVSSYIQYKASEMSEADFLCEVVNQADCGLLLDVNNIFVSSWNHSFDPLTYLQKIPWTRVAQIHLAGPTQDGNLMIDTHSTPVRDETWPIYRNAVKNAPWASSMIEWDADIPELKIVEQELDIARKIYQEVHGTQKDPVLHL